MTPTGGQGQDDIQTDRQTCPIGMGSLLIVNNYSKFEVNIFNKDRDIRKSLILSENSKWKRGIYSVKKLLRVTFPNGISSPFDSKEVPGSLSFK